MQQIIRVISENKADVHVDPLLYRACALDIKHYCADVPRGEGRRKLSPFLIVVCYFLLLLMYAYQCDTSGCINQPLIACNSQCVGESLRWVEMAQGTVHNS